MRSTESNVTQSITQVIAASSLGTLIEWYDFYIFGSLAVIIGQQLFPSDAGASALINTLAIFAAGFIVRPFGALVFGRLGDLIGRKYTFLLTLVLMGGSTFLIGLIPSYSSIGYAAPVLVLILRLVQGLALGGEYGGAATYVAEHAPVGRRGFFTSWIQTTATLGLFLSLGVIVLTKNILGAKNFADWGWRIPFLVSILLVVVSIYIRMKMHESPVFSKLKAEGKVSTNPLKESFQKKANFKMVLVALFGATMGQGVVWYTGQFYAQSFLENTCKLDFNESRYILLWAIVFATPFFVIFGSWSDKVGRKWIMLAGMLLGVICYRPIYQYFLDATNVKEMQKTMLLGQSEPVVERGLVPGKADSLITTTVTKTLTNGMTFKESKVEVITEDVLAEVAAVETVIKDVTLSQSSYIVIILLVFFQVVLVTMVYGPIAAFLVELFPTQIRYTSMSLPYHIGNGVFGGLVPFIATLIASFQGSTPLSGLWYPIGIAALSFIIGAVYIDNRRDDNVMD
ncbi:MFS family permease [Dyadobacter sp. BE34]|uniref:MFS family permease n=1 Tax=Dyadobacter fermentans TaxID=94254 RepID=A0ABU1R201_9BACT|nr:MULTISPECIES: MFS transporter [Dyadobacter]MDR6807420.1 MFS family permease [Dyadobacter fermentans]MDR7045161.1 MFS family permease [Dyadobacter sp. BE242]MDR7199102.1 MFS family permease [Dyadobacter sp. BE34]MDR7217062.1 MFS family permease [Dyadobacter sp. BE31]MDR7264995.1 MFS family permease [Dyadobacter sp. BE32]